MTNALPRPIPSLRIQRRDVINVLVDDAVKDMEKLRKAAQDAADAATRAYVNAVGSAAMKVAEPVITAFKKVSDSNRDFRADYKLRIDYEDAREREIRPLLDYLVVEVNNDTNRYSSDARFHVKVRVTKELRELFDAATAAINSAHRLRAAKTMASYRADAARSVIRQAIANMPEGTALIELMHSLRRQIEKKSGKHLLLTEPEEVLK